MLAAIYVTADWESQQDVANAESCECCERCEVQTTTVLCFLILRVANDGDLFAASSEATCAEYMRSTSSLDMAVEKS